MQTEAIFDSIADRIHLELEQASNSIYIAVAWLTNRNLFNVLLKKAQQGITVQLMLSNDRINKQSYVDYNQLNILNSAAYLIGDGRADLMHNKFCVIDSNTVINGSYNWSYKAEQNHENILITKGDTVLAEQFIKQFKKIRNAYFEHHDDPIDFTPNETINRLEALKNYIILKDIENIARENAELKAFTPHTVILDIKQALQYEQFDEALTLIDKFIKDHNSLALYNDIDIMALKLEIRQLEHQLNAYDNEKTELNKLLSDFYYHHANELGDHISRLLYLRKIFTQDDPLKYAEAVQNEEEYNEKIKLELEKNVYELDERQRSEMKKIYRQASQICHPDRVNEDMKEIAQDVFVQLNQAYKNNDLAGVKNILSELKQGFFKSRSETVSKKNQLKSILQTLKHKVLKIEKDIVEIKGTEDYQTIINITDWNSYFEAVKVQLIEEIDYLEASEHDKNLSNLKDPLTEQLIEEKAIEAMISEVSNNDTTTNDSGYVQPATLYNDESTKTSNNTANQISISYNYGDKKEALNSKEFSYGMNRVKKDLATDIKLSVDKSEEDWLLVVLAFIVALAIIMFILFVR